MFHVVLAIPLPTSRETSRARRRHNIFAARSCDPYSTPHSLPERRESADVAPCTIANDLSRAPFHEAQSLQNN